jgi:hypothetical protein
MNGIKSVFTETKNLLCIWHVEKNILAHCRKYFSNEETWAEFISSWSDCINSPTEADWNVVWGDFSSKYSQICPLAVTYVTEQWVSRKELIVRAFTDRYLHLGSRTTSRGEGNHFCVKRYINLARCDLLRVFQNISLMLETQFTELQKHIEDEKIKTSHRHSNNIFKNLSQKVSHYAMDKILEQFKLIAIKDDPCSGCFTTSFGLPCSHKLHNYVQSNEPIPLDMINPQWILSVDDNIENDTLVISQQMMELSPKSRVVVTLRKTLEQVPVYQQEHIVQKINQIIANSHTEVQSPDVVVKKKGRPVGAKNKSIKRDKSLFEIVADNLSGRKCSLCGEGGHNSRTCLNKASGSHYFVM